MPAGNNCYEGERAGAGADIIERMLGKKYHRRAVALPDFTYKNELLDNY